MNSASDSTTETAAPRLLKNTWRNHLVWRNLGLTWNSFSEPGDGAVERHGHADPHAVRVLTLINHHHVQRPEGQTQQHGYNDLQEKLQNSGHANVKLNVYPEFSLSISPCLSLPPCLSPSLPLSPLTLCLRLMCLTRLTKTFHTRDNS